ncbi:hypothetical protein C8034_v006370 [Colletotrichum sidae]|uniref:Uncharacterized protein n=1 Tax=Colletotrichum sidae TaxID=1347389 RepID=A0A4R8TTV4_9PEZI|nr:hypothetical protein C8034_v006370 [Colletotrichum sidae]
MSAIGNEDAALLTHRGGPSQTLAPPKDALYEEQQRRRGYGDGRPGFEASETGFSPARRTADRRNHTRTVLVHPMTARLSPRVPKMFIGSSRSTRKVRTAGQKARTIHLLLMRRMSMLISHRVLCDAKTQIFKHGVFNWRFCKY